MKWVLVTGATSGIGQACALRLARAGYGVMAGGRRASALRALEAKATREGLNLIPLSLDVTDSSEIDNAARAAELATAGRGIDILINNAGYAQTGFLLELSREQVRQQFEVNLFSVLALTKALLPQLERNRGTVVNIGSVISRVAVPWVGLYGTVKSSLRVLTEVMRMELQAAHIQVVLVEPGAVRTQFFDTAIAQQGVGDEEMRPSRAGSPRLASLSASYARARERLQRGDYRPFRLMPLSSPERVAGLILKVVRRHAVRKSYVVPPGVGALLSLLSLLPASLVDRFKRRGFYLA